MPLRPIKWISEKELRKRYLNETNGAYKVRFLYILKMYDENMTNPKATKVVSLDARRTLNWLHRWNTMGPEGLQAQKSTGRPKKLSNSEENQIKIVIMESPIKYNFDYQVWIPKLMAAFVEREFKKNIHPKTMWRYVHKWNFTLQKPPFFGWPTQ